jgi:hypothetical protein
MTAARRLAPILAADVSGYSHRMSADEAGVARAALGLSEAALSLQTYENNDSATQSDG